MRGKPVASVERDLPPPTTAHLCLVSEAAAPARLDGETFTVGLRSRPDPGEWLGTPAFAVTVYGDPAPQGSKNGRAIYKGTGDDREFTGKIAMHESSKGVKPWRAAVESVARSSLNRSWKPLDGPLAVEFVFTLNRPKAFPARDARRIHGMPTTYPDTSKLIRSTEDALTTAGVWADDALVTDEYAYKRYAGHPEALDQPGAVVRVWRAPLRDSWT